MSRLTFDEIAYKISQMIEPKKPESEGKSAPDGNSASPSHTSSQPNAPQTPKSSQDSTTGEGDKDLDNEEEEEEPCVICHENVSPENLSVLPCAHKLHSQVNV